MKPVRGDTKLQFVKRYMDEHKEQTHHSALTDAIEAWNEYKEHEIAHSPYKEHVARQDFEDYYEYDFYSEFAISKSADDAQLVFGWANIALDTEGEQVWDWDMDVMSPEVLEDAAYRFVINYRDMGADHVGNTKGILIESCVFTKDKQAAIGIPEGVVPEGWWVGFYIPDEEVYKSVKSGEYKMFSIQGKALKIDEEVND